MTNLEKQKFVLRRKLDSNIEKQINILNLQANSRKKINTWEKTKSKKNFNFKNKLFKFLTFGFYDKKKNIENKIILEKIVLNNQTEILADLETQACKIRDEIKTIDINIEAVKAEISNCLELHNQPSPSSINQSNNPSSPTIY